MRDPGASVGCHLRSRATRTARGGLWSRASVAVGAVAQPEPHLVVPGHGELVVPGDRRAKEPVEALRVPSEIKVVDKNSKRKSWEFTMRIGCRLAICTMLPSLLNA